MSERSFAVRREIYIQFIKKKGNYGPKSVRSTLLISLLGSIFSGKFWSSTKGLARQQIHLANNSGELQKLDERASEWTWREKRGCLEF